MVEVKSPDKNAQLVAESIAAQLEGRVSFRRAMKQAIGRAMKFGALLWPCLSGGLSVPCGTLLSSAEALFIASFLAGTFAAPKYLPGVDPDLDAGLNPNGFR